MRKTLYDYFNIFYRGAVHLLLLGITVLVILVVISDLLFPPAVSIAFSLGFLVVFMLVGGLCLYGIWQTTSSQMALDRRLFGFDMTEAREESSKDVIYFYSVLNIYFILNTTWVVGVWFIFPDQFLRAEPLAYILTILSALSGYSTRVIRERLGELDSNAEASI